jgi:hypothetical protein
MRDVHACMHDLLALRGISVSRWSCSVILLMCRIFPASRVSAMVLSRSKRSGTARTSCGVCICGSMTANTVNPRDLSSGSNPASHRLVCSASCCSNTSDTIWMHACVHVTSFDVERRRKRRKSDGNPCFLILTLATMLILITHTP